MNVVKTHDDKHGQRVRTYLVVVLCKNKNSSLLWFYVRIKWFIFIVPTMFIIQESKPWTLLYQCTSAVFSHFITTPLKFWDNTMNYKSMLPIINKQKHIMFLKYKQLCLDRFFVSPMNDGGYRVFNSNFIFCLFPYHVLCTQKDLNWNLIWFSKLSFI